MISTAISTATKSSIKNSTFEVLDANKLIDASNLQQQSYDKVFSNAAMHWILRDQSSRTAFFDGVHGALKPGGTFVFEMGGMGNVGEMRAALLAAVGRRIGIEKARAVDPWFFPDEEWMKRTLEEKGFVVEKSELAYRQTKTETGQGGGIEGWVRLMGKQFFDALEEEGREECVKEVVEVLKTVSTCASGGEVIGYVRLRVKARKL
jgi:trans-aconitate methyltransferase